jgi:CRISPR/Cas system CMR subunit Cmr4 (Cas7 group RAMP superfamily)
MLTGMGKICSKHMRIPYIKNSSEAGAYREAYLKRVEEIGEMEFWVPKRQIKEWNGKSQIMMEWV